ncbi:putative RNA-directed DNA polymerase, eukaryota, reverse transcriptase zinc-binding domain protein [Tanacetum coccineum]
MHEGEWITNPLEVKEAFLSFFKEKFQSSDSMVAFPPLTVTSGLNFDDRHLLEDVVSLVEIKEAVWDRGSDKAPGPDGFSFLFVKRYWELIKLDIHAFVSTFLESGKMSMGSNSAFITLLPKVSNPIYIQDFRPISFIGIHYKIIAKILANRLSKVVGKVVSHEQSAFIPGRQILDGPLMLSEVIDWYKKRKKRLMLFKVDFEKAFDFVSWKYLDFVQNSLGFGSKWRTWIKACLESARTSILVNGSPTSEFSVKRGLIRGIKIGDSDIQLYHLFYADDVVITTEWSSHDMDNIIRVLQVFYVASSLKINILKSNVYGIGVSSDEIHHSDSCVWSLANDDVFSVGITRRYIDDHSLPSLEPSTTWVNILPRKVNIFMWRMTLDRLPHRLNLSTRGMEIHQISCPSCDRSVESNEHIFYECDAAKNIWRLVRMWCDINMPSFVSNNAWKDWLSLWPASKEKKQRVRFG